MDYIFVDTGIFEKNNFLDSKAIKQLLKLAEKREITVVIPKITYNEIIARASWRIRAGIEQLNTAKPSMRVMRNTPSKMSLFDKIRPDEVIAEFTQAFAEQMKIANYLELDYPTLNVTEIFTNYFNGDFPFGKGDKKQEFPDAFALATIEQWCKENAYRCYVFSTDKDILNYTSPYLEIVEDYEVFLNERMAFVIKRDTEAAEAAEFEAVTRARNLMVEKAIHHLSIIQEDIKLELSKWLTENLDDDRRYTDVVNYLEVISIDVEDIDISLNPPEFIDIIEDGVEMEILANVHFIVGVEIPDENTGWFDSEEREWHYFNSTIKNVERDVSIPLRISVEMSSYPNNEIAVHKSSITEINEGQDLVISEEKGWRY